MNGHEWAKRQMEKEGIAFESLDNGFLSCADSKRLQKVCNSLGPEDIERNAPLIQAVATDRASEPPLHPAELSKYSCIRPTDIISIPANLLSRRPLPGYSLGTMLNYVTDPVSEAIPKTRSSRLFLFLDRTVLPLIPHIVAFRRTRITQETATYLINHPVRIRLKRPLSSRQLFERSAFTDL